MTLHNKLTPVLALKLIMSAAFWGGTFIAGKILAQAIPLMTAATLRFLVAAVLLLAITLRMEGRLPRLNRQQVLLTAFSGLTGMFLYNAFFFAALHRIPAGRTALFVCLNPVMTALASFLFLQERLKAIRWVGIFTALLGALIVITKGDLFNSLSAVPSSIGLGELFMIAAITVWVCYTLISRILVRSLTPLVATTYATLWGFLFLFIFALPEFASLNPAAFTWQVCLSILYIGLFGTVLAFVWYYQGIQTIGPSRSAVFMNLVPVFGVLLSSALLGESILASMVIGGAIAIMGVSLTNRK